MTGDWETGRTPSFPITHHPSPRLPSDRRVGGAETRKHLAGNRLEGGDLGRIERIVETDVADAQLRQAAHLVDETFLGLVVIDGAAPGTGLRVVHRVGAAQRRRLAAD